MDGWIGVAREDVCDREGIRKKGGKGRTGVAVVGVGLGGALCDFEIAFVGHLVEGVLAAAEELAGVAMAVGKGGKRGSCQLVLLFEKRCGTVFGEGEDEDRMGGGGFPSEGLYQRMWPSASILVVHSTWPQWHFPW